MTQTFHLISLGCAKNLVDSEVIYGSLEAAGWTQVEDASAANVLIVNTCGFIQPAVEESIEEILQLVELKANEPEKKIVVVGCLVQRYQDKLVESLSEVDLFVGTEGVANMADLLAGLSSDESQARLILPQPFLMDHRTPRRISTPSYRAWLKITEGCDNHCSFCMIPKIRGRLRSRTIDDLISEARRLDSSGVKELSLVAQDLTAYGNDLNNDQFLTELLAQLLGETDIEWIRLLYLYPSGIDQKLIDLVFRYSRIVPYLDIPLQHVSNHILARMNRRYNHHQVVTLFDTIRQRVPDIALRTTFLVGFPGETPEDVEQLATFIESQKIDHVGIFTYANEEGCPAENYSDQLSESVKAERANYLAGLQSDVSRQKIRNYIGTIEPVLIEGVSRETDLLLEGRTRFQAPEIDGCVLINEGTADPGDILDVEITEAQIYDLVGRIV
ncbi:MAG: 30S ribosomal protein S12 methylthiotransferase RimO [Desulfobulbaceae bacterium]|nr:MAG: 30S ribosomal protein S12 methylthiotransferase RimO [Desulfobulbaceae bacterium]